MSYEIFREIYKPYEAKFKEKVCQGDIFSKDFLPVKDIKHHTGWVLINAICDLALIDKGKIDFFRYCPIYPLDHFFRQNIDITNDKIKNALQRFFKWTSTNMFFLPPTKKYNIKEPSYIEIGFIYSSPVITDKDTKPIEVSRNLARDRSGTIISPWRERLAEMLSNSIFRVGVESPEEKNIKLIIDDLFEEHGRKGKKKSP